MALLFLGAGIATFADLGATTAFLAVFLAVTVGILWIVEGVVSLATIGTAVSKGWTVFFAALSIVAGVIVVGSPLWSAVLMWWFIGISLIAIGVMQITRAIALRTQPDHSGE